MKETAGNVLCRFEEDDMDVVVRNAEVNGGCDWDLDVDGGSVERF